MALVPPSPIGRFIPRHSAAGVRDALADTRVVLVNGARQCGKSTLVAQVGQERKAEWRSLDRAATRQAAEYDPTEFVAGADFMIIDEVQRVPELLLAIKETVDADPRPGRFLLTGSQNLALVKTAASPSPRRVPGSRCLKRATSSSACRRSSRTWARGSSRLPSSTSTTRVWRRPC